MVRSQGKQLSSTGAFMQSAGAKLLIIGLNAATGILTARGLAPAGRGELSAMMLWYTVLASIFSLGVPSALTYQLRRHPGRISDLGGAALLLTACISILAGFVGYIGLPHWIPQYSPQVIFLARVFLFNLPVAVFVVIGRAALESEGNFSASNVSLLGPPAITLAGLLVLIYLHQLSPASAAWCYVVSGIPPFLWTAFSFCRIVRPRFREIRNSARLLLSYGIRSYGIDLCGTLSLYVDQALVVRILRPSLMGTYVVALSLSRMLNAFHTAVVMVLFPRAVARPPLEVRDLTGRAVRMTTLLTTLSGLGIMLAGPRLLIFLYGPEYRSAAAILRILVVEVILAGATQVMSQAFMALSRPGVITTLQAIGLMLTVPLMLVLVPKYGIAGAALALLLSTCARFVFVVASFSIFLKMPCPDLLLCRADLLFMRGAISGRLRGFQPSAVGGEA